MDGHEEFGAAALSSNYEYNSSWENSIAAFFLTNRRRLISQFDD